MSICGKAICMPSEIEPYTKALKGTSATDDGPTFEEAWHAQVLGVAHALTVAGLFTPAQWSDALGAALRDLEGSGPDDQHLYYRAALQALEALVGDSGKLGNDELSVRVEDWRSAYLSTPHGQPVALSKT